MRPFDLSLYLVLDPVLCGGLGMIETARRAVAGGATMVQLRHKTASTAEMIEIGRALKRVLSESNTPLVINDDVDAAIEVGADGVHVGQEDARVTGVRHRVGRDILLGLSIDTLAQAQKIDLAAVDYVGLGPVFATGTKPDHAPAIGLDGLAMLCAACPLPAVAIGGLKSTHVPAVFAAGAKGIAVVSAVCGMPDPQAAARIIADEIARTKA